MRNALYVGIMSFLFFLILPYSNHSEAQSTIVTPLVETGSSHHSGDTADDSVIWIHPTDPSQSVVIGDDKNGGMMVWNLNGSEIQYLDGTKLLNNVDLRYNFPLRGTYSDGTAHTHVALVVVGNENGGSLSIYKVNPAPRKLEPIGVAPKDGEVR